MVLTDPLTRAAATDMTTPTLKLQVRRMGVVSTLLFHLSDVACTVVTTCPCLNYLVFVIHSLSSRFSLSSLCSRFSNESHPFVSSQMTR